MWLTPYRYCHTQLTPSRSLSSFIAIDDIFKLSQPPTKNDADEIGFTPYYLEQSLSFFDTNFARVIPTSQPLEALFLQQILKTPRHQWKYKKSYRPNRIYQ